MGVYIALAILVLTTSTSGNFVYQYFTKKDWERAAALSFHQMIALMAFLCGMNAIRLLG